MPIKSYIHKSLEADLWDLLPPCFLMFLLVLLCQLDLGVWREGKDGISIRQGKCLFVTESRPKP